MASYVEEGLVRSGLKVSGEDYETFNINVLRKNRGMKYTLLVIVDGPDEVDTKYKELQDMFSQVAPMKPEPIDTLQIVVSARASDISFNVVKWDAVEKTTIGPTLTGHGFASLSNKFLVPCVSWWDRSANVFMVGAPEHGQILRQEVTDYDPAIREPIRIEIAARNHRIGYRPPPGMEDTDKRRCEECGILFTPKCSDQVYHDRHCAVLAGDRRRRRGRKGIAAPTR